MPLVACSVACGWCRCSQSAIASRSAAARPPPALTLSSTSVIAGAGYSTYASILGFVAVTCATINVVGGFIITDRMLKMFKRNEKKGVAK